MSIFKRKEMEKHTFHFKNSKELFKAYLKKRREELRKESDKSEIKEFIFNLDEEQVFPKNTQGINELLDLSKTLIQKYETKQEKRLENIEMVVNKIEDQNNLQLKLEILEEVQIENNFDNIYSKQLITQYKEKVMENNGEKISVNDFLNIQIKHDKSVESSAEDESFISNNYSN